MSWERAEEIRKANVSQTEKAVVIAEILNGETDVQVRCAIELGYDAGYRAAREGALKLFEFGSTFRREDVVEAIRKLEPKG